MSISIIDCLIGLICCDFCWCRVSIYNLLWCFVFIPISVILYNFYILFLVSLLVMMNWIQQRLNFVQRHGCPRRCNWSNVSCVRISLMHLSSCACNTGSWSSFVHKVGCLLYTLFESHAASSLWHGNWTKSTPNRTVNSNTIHTSPCTHWLLELIHFKVAKVTWWHILPRSWGLNCPFIPFGVSVIFVIFFGSVVPKIRQQVITSCLITWIVVAWSW